MLGIWELCVLYLQFCCKAKLFCKIKKKLLKTTQQFVYLCGSISKFFILLHLSFHALTNTTYSWLLQLPAKCWNQTAWAFTVILFFFFKIICYSSFIVLSYKFLKNLVYTNHKSCWKFNSNCIKLKYQFEEYWYLCFVVFSNS